MPYDKEMYKQLNFLEKLILKIIDRPVQIVFDKVRRSERFSEYMIKYGSIEHALKYRLPIEQSCDVD